MKLNLSRAVERLVMKTTDSPLFALAATMASLPVLASDARVDSGRLSIPDIPVTFQAIAYTPDWKSDSQSGAYMEDGDGRYPFKMKAGECTVRGAATYRLQDGAIQAEWTMAPDKDVKLACLAVTGTLPISRYGGGMAVCDGTEVPLPRKHGDTRLFGRTIRNLSVRDASGRERFALSFPEPTPVLLQDNRRWSADEFEIRVQAGSGEFKAGESRRIAFALTGGEEERGLRQARKTVIQAGPDWLPVTVEPDIVLGSALDFSSVVPHDAPAGKHGYVVARGQNFEFENLPGVPQRFYGVNLCFGANYPNRDSARRIAELFSRIGYNAVRFHHHDGAWAAAYAGRTVERSDGRTVAPSDPQTIGLSDRQTDDGIDRFDYLAAAFIEQGIYLTTDLFVSRPVPYRACGIDRIGNIPMDTFKTLVQFHEGAYQNYISFARQFLDHRNPYTGRRYADEPALSFLSLVNEGNLGNHGTKVFQEWPECREAWESWIAARKAEDPARYGDIPSGFPENLWDGGNRHVAVFVQFLREREERFAKRVTAFLRDEMRCRALTTNMNCWFYPVAFQLPRGESYDYVDDHFYVDHPHFLERSWRLPSSCPNVNPMANAAMGAQGLVLRRLLDRPFTITEYNYAAPGRFRGVGGIATGAAAALQNWAGLWRFAWSHDPLGMTDPAHKPLAYFDMAGDPLSLAAERASICLFLRRDLDELPVTYAYALPPAELAKADGTGRQAGADWTWASWYAKVGGFLADKVPDGAMDAGSFREALSRKSNKVREALLGADPAAPRLRMGNGALEIDKDQGSFLLRTPRTCGGFAEGGELRADALVADLGDTAATVWASSLDDKPLRESGRVLVTHLTDVQNSGATFASDERKILLAWGYVPHLMAAGKARVSLQLADRPWKVYSLTTGGRRRREVSAAYADGRLSFTADIAADPAEASFLYEVVAETQRTE